MAMCKLRIRRLTLAPGTLGPAQSEEEAGEIDEEEDRILARMHLHRAAEVSIESSLSHRTGPHVHGVDDRLCGRFWATGNDSESESDAVVEEQTDLLPNVSASDLKSSLGV
jgi:hypothetical protein